MSEQLNNQSGDKFTGPWIPAGQIPDVLREFNLNRDPYIARQIRAQELSEAERREQQGRASNMVEKDKPEFNLTPPASIRKPVERRQFNFNWLREKRDAAFEQAAKQQSSPEHSREHTKLYQREHTR